MFYSKPAMKMMQSGPPSSTIFIGNSFFYYNNGIHAQVTKLLAAASPAAPYRSTMATISGSGLDWHDVESYFRPGAIGRYSFDADNNVVFNKLTKLFDAAVIMDSSQGPIHPELAPVFDDYIVRNIATIRKHGTEPVLFMSWAYADKPAMTAPLAERYTRAGNEQNALVIPAGLAFAHCLAQKPGLNLYAEDKRHPGLEGTYLAGCTAYACLFNTSPVGSSWTSGLDAETARFLQSVAWETVRQYFDS